MSATPTWKADLARDGFAVIKGAVPVDRANAYVERGLTWLEGFDYSKGALDSNAPATGFKRDDPSTWTAAHLPDHYVGGLFTGYSCSHESWVWESRTCVLFPSRDRLQGRAS